MLATVLPAHLKAKIVTLVAQFYYFCTFNSKAPSKTTTRFLFSFHPRERTLSEILPPSSGNSTTVARKEHGCSMYQDLESWEQDSRLHHHPVYIKGKQYELD